MFNSPKPQVEQAELTIAQMDNLLRAPSKEDNYDQDIFEAENGFSKLRMSPGPVRAFSLFPNEHIKMQDSSLPKNVLELAPYKKQTLLITSTKDRASPSHAGYQVSPVRTFDLDMEVNLRSGNCGYKQYAQKRISKLNMEHVHTQQPECMSPSSNIDDCKLTLNSQRYLKAPVKAPFKANVATCNTCTSEDQNVASWKAAPFDLSAKEVPTNTFDSPSHPNECNYV